MFWDTLCPLLTFMCFWVVRSYFGVIVLTKGWIIPPLARCLPTRDYCKYLRGTVDMKITLTNGYTSLDSEKHWWVCRSDGGKDVWEIYWKGDRGKKEGWKCGKRQKVEREVGEGHVEEWHNWWGSGEKRWCGRKRGDKQKAGGRKTDGNWKSKQMNTVVIPLEKTHDVVLNNFNYSNKNIVYSSLRVQTF